MLPYRVYLLDAADHIRSAQDLECVSDEEALESAARLAQGITVEVWSGARLVGRHPPALAAAGGALPAQP